MSNNTKYERILNAEANECYEKIDEFLARYALPQKYYDDLRQEIVVYIGLNHGFKCNLDEIKEELIQQVYNFLLQYYNEPELSKKRSIYDYEGKLMDLLVYSNLREVPKKSVYTGKEEYPRTPEQSAIVDIIFDKLRDFLNQIPEEAREFVKAVISDYNDGKINEISQEFNVPVEVINEVAKVVFDYLQSYGEFAELLKPTDSTPTSRVRKNTKDEKRN